MNRLKFVLIDAVMAFMATFAVQSCSLSESDLDVNNFYPNAIVTVKTTPAGETYFQLNDETVLFPVDWKNTYKKEVRALVNYSEVTDDAKNSNSSTEKQVRVNWIDSVLTKKAVSMTDQEMASETGNDPVEVIDDWMTVCEDGYLTIHFASQWGEDKIMHKVTLGVNPDNPHQLCLKHDKNGDFGTYWSDGIVAFWLGDLIPDTKGEVVTLTMSWKSFSGSVTKEFKYKTRN